MGKIIGKFTLIMVVNLLAFLSVWYILDLFFESGTKMTIIFLILSIFSLVWISSMYFKSALDKMEEISPKIEEQNNNQNK